MYTIIYKLYYVLKRKQKGNRLSGVTDSRMLERLLDYCELFFNKIVVKWYTECPSSRLGISKKERDKKIIISLTSFPGRIDSVWITIETLLRQSMKPDKIILWLADSQFDGLEVLPEKLLKQMERGLEIRFCDDLRSHKKYYYTMQEWPNDIIILVDDDSFYPYDMVEKLMSLHEQYPNEIIGSTVAMVDDIYSLPDNWGRPKPGQRIIHSEKVQPFSGQGTLYPADSLDRNFLFDKNLIKTLCPNADDLWLFYMAYRKGTLGSVVFKERSMPVPIYGTYETSLFLSNGLDRQNDTQWKAILEYFGEKNE